MQRYRIPWCIGQLAVVFVVAPALGGEKIPPQPVSGKIAWVYDYEEGRDAALRSGKPMFVVFRCER